MFQNYRQEDYKKQKEYPLAILYAASIIIKKHPFTRTQIDNSLPEFTSIFHPDYRAQFKDKRNHNHIVTQINDILRNNIISYYNMPTASEEQQGIIIKHTIKNNQPLNFIVAFTIGCLLVNSDIKNKKKHLVKTELIKCLNILHPDLQQNLTEDYINTFLQKKFTTCNTATQDFIEFVRHPSFSELDTQKPQTLTQHKSLKFK